MSYLRSDNQNRTEMTYTDSDFERFYLRYKAEVFQLYMPAKTYCIRNKVPYIKFNKWFRNTRHRIVPVVVDGMPEELGDSVEVAIPAEGQQATSSYVRHRVSVQAQNRPKFITSQLRNN